jgi:hypothetical protein
MRIVRNLIKYTLGLPILLVITLALVIGYVIALIIGLDEVIGSDVVFEDIKTMWELN